MAMQKLLGSEIFAIDGFGRKFKGKTTETIEADK
jgi:hypothetical protein